MSTATVPQNPPPKRKTPPPPESIDISTTTAPNIPLPATLDLAKTNANALIEKFERDLHAFYQVMRERGLELLRTSIANAEDLETLARERERQTASEVEKAKKLKTDILRLLNEDQTDGRKNAASSIRPQ